MTFTDGIVAILNSDGNPVGTGFIVHEKGYIATCVHVLELIDASTSVTIRFHANKGQDTAYIMPNWHDADADVAILVLHGDLPEAVQPLPLTTSQHSNGRKFVSFGYPNRPDFNGLGGTGEVILTVDENGQDRLQLRSEETTHGYSGGPIWDPIWGKVIGMTRNGLRADGIGRGGTTAFAVPTETLATICPELILQPIPNQPINQSTPIQLPPRPPVFLGRDAAIAQLTADLQTTAVVTLAGAGGMGKSSLAAETLHRLHDTGHLLRHFPGGLITHEFYNQPQVAQAMTHIVTTLGGDPRGDLTSTTRQLLSRQPCLLLLDGAEQADNLSRLLGLRGQATILITTRNRTQAEQHHQLVDQLPLPDAVAVLQEWAGELAADTTAIEQIAWEVGRLPLALRLAGSYMAEQTEPAAAYLAWLQAQPLDALDLGDRQQKSVRLLLERTVAHLSDGARQILSVMGALALSARWS